LNYYGITGNSLSWIENFLLDRTQFLGPLLFLIYINDIVHNLNTKIKLFADDAVLYSEVSNVHDMTRP
ncbi:unnamed protein product, partial [Porites lobata]